MRASIVTSLGLAAALLTASCAPTTGTEASASADSPRQCFLVQQVNNFRQGNTGQIFLRVGRNDVFELATAGGCRDIDYAIRLGIAPDIGGVGGTRLCTNDGARIIVPDAATPADVCRVRIVRQLTDEQVAALPQAHRP